MNSELLIALADLMTALDKVPIAQFPPDAMSAWVKVRDVCTVPPLSDMTQGEWFNALATAMDRRGG